MNPAFTAPAPARRIPPLKLKVLLAPATPETWRARNVPPLRFRVPEEPAPLPRMILAPPPLPEVNVPPESVMVPTLPAPLPTNRLFALTSPLFITVRSPWPPLTSQTFKSLAPPGSARVALSFTNTLPTPPSLPIDIHAFTTTLAEFATITEPVALLCQPIIARLPLKKTDESFKVMFAWPPALSPMFESPLFV